MILPDPIEVVTTARIHVPLFSLSDRIQSYMVFGISLSPVTEVSEETDRVSIFITSFFRF